MGTLYLIPSIGIHWDPPPREPERGVAGGREDPDTLLGQTLYHLSRRGDIVGGTAFEERHG